MEKEHCFYLGRISKTQGYKGKLILFLDVDHPEDYRNLESVYVAKQHKLIPFFIEEITLLHKGFARVKFEDIDDENRAGELVKCALYLPADNLPDLGDDGFYYHEITGYEVEDEFLGNIGKVANTLDIPGNPQLIVLYQGREVYIPVSDAFYRGIDKTAKILYVSLPEGLVDVNL